DVLDGEHADRRAGRLGIVIIGGRYADGAVSVRIRGPEVAVDGWDPRPAIDEVVDLHPVPGSDALVAVTPSWIGTAECRYADAPLEVIGPMSCVTVLDGDGRELATLGPP